MVAIPRLTVRTEFGSVMAVPHRGSLLFRNVPFAAPPFGVNRFRPPQRPEVWDGLRDGAEPGVGMPQPTGGDPLHGYTGPKRQGSDALTLEVQTPELGAANLPVMVWLHGGGFIRGAGSAQVNDGYAFARSGIVHVAVNSRLGIDGYALLDDSVDNHADNLGLRDQVAALEWVQRNIAAFGGDPARVTIAGQSTGASSVGYLLATPAARGLFAQAFSQSGSSANWMPVDEARGVAQRLGQIVGRPATADSLRDLDFDETAGLSQRLLAEYYGNPAAWGTDGRIPMPFCGVVGTEMLPQNIVSAVAAGTADDIRILAGTTKDETSYMFETAFGRVLFESEIGRQMRRALGADEQTIARLRGVLPPNASDIAILGALATDVWAKRPTVDLISAHGGVHFLYEFTWESPYLEEGRGAAQGMDLPFFRDDFESMRQVPRGRSMLGKTPSESLAVEMNSAFVDFVTTGEPGWPAWAPGAGETRYFDVHSASYVI